MTKGIFWLTAVAVGAVILTLIYNYIVLNQLDFIIVGNFVFPYTAANEDRVHPAVYTFSRSMSKDWILNIQNTLSYALRPDAKVVIKLQEPIPKQRFIEIIMYGNTTYNRFLAALNISEVGCIKLCDKNGVDGWSTSQPIIITYDNNHQLSINLGQAMVYKLPLNDFALDSIVVYGKDYEYSPLNAYAGHISFEALWSRPSYTIFYLPLVMLVGIGGLLIVFLVFKKGNSS